VSTFVSYAQNNTADPFFQTRCSYFDNKAKKLTFMVLCTYYMFLIYEGSVVILIKITEVSCHYTWVTLLHKSGTPYL